MEAWPRARSEGRQDRRVTRGLPQGAARQRRGSRCGSSPSRPACPTPTSARSNAVCASRRPRCSSRSRRRCGSPPSSSTSAPGSSAPSDGSGRLGRAGRPRRPGLTERQKQSLLDVYASFLALNAARRPQDELSPTDQDHPTAPSDHRRRSHMATSSTSRPKPPARCTPASASPTSPSRSSATTSPTCRRRSTKIDLEPQALRDQAVTVVNSRVDALTKDAKARRTAVEARVAELQAEAGRPARQGARRQRHRRLRRPGQARRGAS